MTPEEIKSSDYFRFINKIEFRENGCVEWIGSLNNPHKYGFFWMNGRSVSAHRLSYVMTYQKDITGSHILHKCDNPSCVNPKHLFSGTCADNVTDRVMKGRSARGSAHGASKLNEEDVRFIKERLLRGDTQKNIATDYGVARTTIAGIKTGKNWGWLT